MRKIFWFFIVPILVIGFIGCAYVYYTISTPQPLHQNAGSNKSIYISTGAQAEEVEQQLFDSLPGLNQMWFSILSGRMNPDGNYHAGRYLIPSDLSILGLIRKLRSGLQDPVKVVLRPAWRFEQMASKVSAVIEADSASLVQMYYKLFTDSLPFPIILPNTYEFYWNTTADEFFTRMKKESDAFWQKPSHIASLQQIKLSAYEAYILASIVFRETTHQKEMARIAGVYLNRLESGMLLQADPTVKYAIGKYDLTRILTRHTETDSPFNTYLYPGLPPAPISIPSMQSILGVLQAEAHDYYYFCAKPDFSGQHQFARSYRAHLSNAKRFHSWLNQQNIR